MTKCCHVNKANGLCKEAENLYVNHLNIKPHTFCGLVENEKKSYQVLVHISGMPGQIQLKFGIGGVPPPKGVYTVKFVQGVSS